MELFCSLLTGFFLWLFFYHWHHTALARARELGGGLLIEVRAAGEFIRKARKRRRWAGVTTFMFALVILLHHLPGTPSADLRGLMTAVMTWSILGMLVPTHRIDAPLELRERGVVRRKQSYENYPGRLTFTPWDHVVGCKWLETLPDHYLYTRFLLLESDGLSAAEIEAITAVAARFVSVTTDGRLLSDPEPTVKPGDADWGGPTTPAWRFQFNLQSLLLLMVVVSCAASCYGIHYRRLQPQREAVAQLQAFGAKVDCLGEIVYSVDFKTSATKPGDDDLVHLERLQDLSSLDLDGSPITDNGLKYLYPIKTLRTVSLWNTKVTQKGVDDLQRALPHVHIGWFPPRAPVARPPVGGQ